MSAKSRKRRKRRRSGPAESEPSRQDHTPAPGPPARRREVDEPPEAPWGSFPLIELTVLAGIVMLVAGFFFVGGERGTVFIVTGLGLASIGGLEVAIREHFAGYRSHTLVLAGVPAAVVLAALFFIGPEGLPPVARGAIALAVFVVAAVLLVRLFRDRSGGSSFKLTTFRRR